jgi:DNA adenine methylase
MHYRIGSKAGIAHLIYPLFPPHITYIELFFGGGGMYFSKPRAKYNICNDIDNEVYNLYTILQNKELREKLLDELELIPIHNGIFQEMKTKEETDPVKKAINYLYVTSFSYMGLKSSIHARAVTNVRDEIIKMLRASMQEIKDVIFLNMDYKTALAAITYRETEKGRTLIYADSPYCESGNNRVYKSWTEEQTRELIQTLTGYGARFAMSEFDHPAVIDEAQKCGLRIIPIVERQNLKNRRTEILLVNYEINDLFSTM